MNKLRLILVRMRMDFECLCGLRALECGAVLGEAGGGEVLAEKFIVLINHQ